MITRDFQGMPKRDVYRILSSLVVPRPIAWVLTRDGEGHLNLAPFSSFQGIFGPPMVAMIDTASAIRSMVSPAAAGAP